jgi:hypothetical protein
VMAMVLVAGGACFAWAGVQECLPKACCCMQGAHTAAPRMGEIDAKSGCTGSAPCCQLASSNETHDRAVPNSRFELPQSKSFIQIVTPGRQLTAPPTPSSARTLQHNGKPGAPRVPLYLETQMLLC